jgi:phosphinothricin acetyltransferase
MVNVARIRRATKEDATAVQAIYGPVVVGSAASFEYDEPSVPEMARRIERTLERLPWLVAERAREVVGYAYAAPHAERAAYAWSVNTSVYVAAESRGLGHGRALYDDLVRILIDLGYVSAYAGITLPNEASISLHEATGYVRVGSFPAAGYKFGQWHDVGWWHRVLRPYHVRPESPTVYAAT